MTRRKPKAVILDARPAPDPIAAARDGALKLLANLDLSRQELAERLAKKHRPEAIDAALAELSQLRLVNDRRVAASHVRQRLESAPAARALLEHELAERGIASDTATEVLTELLAGRDESRDAHALARERVRTAPARLAPEAILRRTFAFLARRGFDEETARQATEAAGEEYLGRP
jgi:regulatory protein